ncbi:bifunctional 4-hydroxy-2-oxoglutarate aldolase/2-dehydro-3-deoxy-phosphogluconate aldolase [Oscillospiraceae bacterium MB08-C2-2]|nr:bifunctional 4-hydroxy-2-oxoglutarate aldolase/2-dehydro-3-deoxy-phosphogluconate aldolase [Oscillospiraceae bacterium MB08-C2-2]
MSNTMKRIADTGLVPVVVIDDASKAVATGRAMAEGGVDIMEITLRTEAGMESIANVIKECPDILVGGGTVLTLDKCKEAIKLGAKFIVSPGYNPEIVHYCLDNGISVCPGCVTPTEIDTAIRAGISVIKFFPANVYGGIKAIKSLAGPFGGVQFIPTGGVALNNLVDFIDPSVYAVGGGWLCDRSAINKGDFASITEICKKSIDVLLGLKSGDTAITLDELMAKGGTVTTINKNRTVSQLSRRGFVQNPDGTLSREGIVVTLA